MTAEKPILTEVDGRTYVVEKIEGDRPTLRADLIKRGFDGESYTLTGKWGAVYLAHCRRDGSYVIVNNA